MFGKSSISRAVAVVSCVACGVLAAPTLAGATVNNTSSQWGQPSSPNGGQVTAVYSIQSVGEATAGGVSNALLEDWANFANNGALTDVFAQVNQSTGQDPMATQNGHNYPMITQANELWEFVPQAGNTGGLLSSGYGELINRQSGLCLDVNGSDPNEYRDGASVDQWTCGGGPNQAWTLKSVSGFANAGWGLAPQSDNGTGVLGIGNGGSCTPHGNDDRVYVRTTGITSNPCDRWNVQQQSYDYATYPISIMAGAVTSGNNDNRTYGCLSASNLRESSYDPDYDAQRIDEGDSGSPTWWWDYANISTGAATANNVLSQASDPSNPPNSLAGGTLSYSSYTVGQTGQILLYCDPQSSAP